MKNILALMFFVNSTISFSQTCYFKARVKITIILLLFITTVNAQEKWVSPKYDYKVEIPKGFKKSYTVGRNVDFRAIKGRNSIVIVVNKLPNEYTVYSIWEILGDLDEFTKNWEVGANEYMDNPRVLKYGKTKVNGYDTFWYDYTTDNPKLYSKNYQIQKGNKVYTITLTCENANYNNLSPVWYKFKESIKF